jgi:hypothetical protein
LSEASSLILPHDRIYLNVWPHVEDCSLDTIVRALPFLQCRQCGETELENIAMARVDRLLAPVDRSAELEVVRYAA